jgi:hypothetical protein
VLSCCCCCVVCPQMVREGTDVSIFTYSRMRYVVMQAVAELEKKGYNPEVCVDLGGHCWGREGGVPGSACWHGTAAAGRRDRLVQNQVFSTARRVGRS